MIKYIKFFINTSYFIPTLLIIILIISISIGFGLGFAKNKLSKCDNIDNTINVYQGTNEKLMKDATYYKNCSDMIQKCTAKLSVHYSKDTEGYKDCMNIMQNTCNEQRYPSNTLDLSASLCNPNN